MDVAPNGNTSKRAIIGGLPRETQPSIYQDPNFVNVYDENGQIQTVPRQFVSNETFENSVSMISINQGDGSQMILIEQMPWVSGRQNRFFQYVQFRRELSRSSSRRNPFLSPRTKRKRYNPKRLLNVSLEKTNLPDKNESAQNGASGIISSDKVVNNEYNSNCNIVNNVGNNIGNNVNNVVNNVGNNVNNVGNNIGNNVNNVGNNEGNSSNNNGNNGNTNNNIANEPVVIDVDAVVVHNNTQNSGSSNSLATLNNSPVPSMASPPTALSSTYTSCMPFFSTPLALRKDNDIFKPVKYIFINPVQGQICLSPNVRWFCARFHLNKNTVSNLKLKRIPSYRGWIISEKKLLPKGFPWEVGVFKCRPKDLKRLASL